MQNRLLPFDHIYNFRDYGDYAVEGGGRLKTGLLFRSAQHSLATANDHERVSALALETIFDLRGDSERRAHPLGTARRNQIRIVEGRGETAHETGHNNGSLGIRDAAEARQFMLSLYRGMPFRVQLVDIFKAYFDALARSGAPTLIHCVAGKDRTGLGVSLLHSLVGVHPDDRMADYLLTNNAGDQEARIAAQSPSVKKNYGEELDEAGVRALMSVDADYLNTALATIREQYHTVEHYCEDVLGVTSAQREAIKTNVLVSA